MRPPSLRLVIDTNVWISGLLTKSGTPAKLTRHVILTARPVFCVKTFAELQDRLWRPKFDRYVSIEQRQAFLRDVDSVAEWVELDARPDLTGLAHSRDPDDDKFIHTALAGEADVLVSGDRDLLDLGRVGELQILSPADALAWMAQL